MERQRFKLLTDRQKDIILALHKSELTSRQIAEVAQCAQSTVIRHLQKFQETGQLPMTERRKTTRYPTANSLPNSSNETSPTTTTTTPTTLLTVNFKYGDRNYGHGMSEIIKEPINEQLNYYNKPIARLSYTNMMEVKHSPSSQMDFRNASTNGLPAEEEDEEMDTLLDNSSAAVKSIPNSSLDCDSTPILNGSSKYSGLEDGMEIDLLDDDVDDEPNTTVSDSDNKKKHEETDAQTEDIDIFDLDLEQAVETGKKLTNGKTTGSSIVRDTGDDLDTLLSKINDLVEDCMEPSANADSPTTANKEVVKDKAEDITNNKAKETQEDACEETKVVELEETIDEEETVEDPEVEIVKDVDSKSQKKEEEKVESEIEEELTRDEEAFEVKSMPDSPEDVSEENGVEVTESDLETAEGGSLKEVHDKISEVCAEEVVVAESNEEKPEEEMPAHDTSEEITAIEIVEEVTAGETVESGETVAKTTDEDVKKSVKPAESMDLDDEIVCLDSPLPEEKEEEEESIFDNTKEENALPLSKDSMPVPKEGGETQLETKSKETPIEKKVSEEVPLKKVVLEEAVTQSGKGLSKALEEDDEIFLIEDDDEPLRTTESDGKPNGRTENTLNSQTEEENVQEGEKISEKEKLKEKLSDSEESSVEKSKENDKPEKEKDKDQIEKKTEVGSERKPLETKEDEDDVVCLDDSFEETEDPKQSVKEKPTEVIPQKIADKFVDRDVSVTFSKKSNESDKDKHLKSDDKIVRKVSEDERGTKTANEKGVEPLQSLKKSGDSLEQVIESVDDSEKLKKVLKPSEEFVKETTNITSEEAPSVPKDTSQGTSEAEVSAKILIHSDVISLDDDDEDDAALSAAKILVDTKPSDEVPATKSLAFLSDNSDNARDGVDEKDDKTVPKETAVKSTPMPSEMNSNSSSNLLKESTTTEREESRSEPSEQPPAKRIRLSQDEASSRNSIASQEDTTSKLLDDDDVMEINDNDDEATKALKRVHSSESIPSEFKKPKTDTESSKVEEEKQPELLEEIIPAKVEPAKVDEKVDRKLVDAKPLPLYPPPNFDAPKIGLSLDFLRRFKKSIHKMNKSDLEELVLQKIVEAIVHKSEFSEMREMIEKQEKIISGHRSKITELNKQFRDLEMVHNRVLKDLETKNSQFIMPVKITRAVGLQVFFPSKKYDQPMSSLASSSSAHAHPPSSSSLARSVSTSSNASSIPEKTPIATPASLNNPSPQALVQTAPAGVSNQPRRGCVQKLTPMRPDGPRSQMANRGVTPGVVSSSTPSPMTPKDTSPKILNRQIAPKPRLSQSPMGVNASNSVLPQQAHNLHPLSTPPGPEPERTKSMPQGIATKKTGGMVKSYPASKRIPKSWQSEQPAPVQPSPLAPQNTSSPMALPQSPLLNSPSVAKTPHKSVIDLTDEDEMAPTPSPKPPNATAASQKQANAGMHRVGPYKVSVIPAVQLQQQPRPNQPKAIHQRPPQNSSQLVPKPNGIAPNTVRRTPPLNQRYRHPAPLPNQPIHSSNPLWKLPPARPTIRISNLDSGIVISWTIEDMAKEKYAESTSYQIYAYQETSGPPLVESWRHVGDVKAMLLPMAVTLTQFQEGQRYYFAVRAVDAHNRCGPFSFAKTWS